MRTPLAFLVAAASVAAAQTPQQTSALTWRNLGPFRGGRTAAVSGAIGTPGTFYIGLPSGGVWKTTSAGEVWYPVFDAVKDVSSIGSIDVAPSDASVIYTGTGDIITGGAINEGNGVYKSTDAGATWKHMGLDNTKQIPSLLVDPGNPNTVLVAAQGDIHVKSHDRGIFRTTDGGATWNQTLFVNDSTGAQKIARAFDTPNVLFATTVAHYTPAPLPPSPSGGNLVPGAGQNQGGPTNSKIFKSTDDGVTWTEVSGGGLPARMTGKVWVAVANKTNGQRVFVIGDWGLYRSDDGGATWHQMAADDPRIRNGQGGYNCGVYVDPDDPERVYTFNTASYVSTDGGRTFTGFKGAPGGDDPQQAWIDPTNGARILFGYDQGAIVSLDRGHTWSSWYKQSVEQIYHLAVDHSFPYWVYGTQQDAGAIRMRSRGNLGQINAIAGDWNPVPGWEWGSIMPDPLDNNTVYSTGSGVVKISMPSETWIDVSPSQDPALKLRTMQDWPLAFAPWNPKMLVVGFDRLMSTIDGGQHWTAISPDLAARADRPAGSPPTGAVQSISMSTVKPGVIWAGTNTGQIKVTPDGGKTWSDATIPNLPFYWRAEVFTIEASHFDANEAYAAIDLHRSGDYAPYVYRTRDMGKTWTKIVDGLPAQRASGAFARVVRNDTKRKGLLFAGTESGAYVSFDDGDHWQSLQNNLPTTSVRDAVIKDNDLVITTYGRGFWVLDDISSLRQMSAPLTYAHLYKPGNAARVRRNPGADTPIPPEEAHALNPAPGVQLDYWLPTKPSYDLTIDVRDPGGNLVRHMTSAASAPVEEAARPPEPNFWLAPPFALPKNAGANRTNWDLRYDPPKVFSHSFEINANPGLTPAGPEGPLVLPGNYTLTLTANGVTSTQTVTVTMDPRAPGGLAAIVPQHVLQMKILQGVNASYEMHDLAVKLRDALNASSDYGTEQARVTGILARLDTIGGLDASRRRGRGGAGSAPANFVSLNSALAGQLTNQEWGDNAPSTGALAAFSATCKELSATAAAWSRLVSVELGALNTALTASGKKAISVQAASLKVPVC
jgi:photosystem II stability/assembly factor-like uncharacterized protein